MRILQIKWLSFLFTALLLVNVNVQAATLSSSALLHKNVVQVEVLGNRYVETEAILATLDTKVGEPFERRTLSRDIQRLYGTGNYADLKILGEAQGHGVKLTLKIKENPFITSYSVTGNDEITYKDMKRKLKLKEGVVFSATKLRMDINTIRKGYLKKGFYQVTVQVEKKILADGSMSLVLNIHEGDKTHIRQIRFVGNEAFSDTVLTDIVSADISKFATWFSNKDVIDTKRFSNDSQRLLQFYQNRGYLDMSVESAQLSLTPDKKSFYLTFSLHEGPVYHVSQLDVQGDLVPSKKKLLDAITLEKGGVYVLDDMRASLDAMSLLVGDEGYAFNSVTPLFKRDIAAQTVAVTFDIEKGREIYIERIEIEGNEKTDDGVIRREVQIDESQRFSATGMQHTKERLTRSELFKDVRVSIPRGTTANRVNAKIKVEEDKTGSFTFGVGYSQVEKVLVRATVKEKNFLGQGYNVNVSGDIGSITQNFNVSLTDPYFIDENIRASVNVKKTQTKLNTIQTSSYRQNDIGGGVDFQIPLSEYLSYSIGYQYLDSNITNVAANASFLLQSQKGRQTTGELSQSLNYDTRDRFVGTTSGYHHSLSLGVAGLAGNNHFWELGASMQGFLPVSEDYTLRGTFGGRMIQGYGGKAVPIYRRYSLGGVGSLRGFDYYGVSLRDPLTGDPVGGDKQLTGSIDLFFPMPYMQTSGIRGVLFMDAGSVWGKEITSNVSAKFNRTSIRASAGVGIEWISPVGPLTLSWSKVIKSHKVDLLRSFEFGLGTSF